MGCGAVTSARGPARYYSDKVTGLVEACLQRVPAQRPSMQDLLQTHARFFKLVRRAGRDVNAARSASGRVESYPCVALLVK